MRDHHEHRSAPTTTRQALQTFRTIYYRHTGRCLRWSGQADDVHALRAALEQAAGDGGAELYSAAEQLVLALRAAPLPVSGGAQ